MEIEHEYLNNRLRSLNRIQASCKSLSKQTWLIADGATGVPVLRFANSASRT